MASTTQSALEYVRGARTHLVKTLKNLSVILENLKQQGVLRDEEVSRIQAEGNDYDKNRNLLDSVTKKGEAASYEFLKIIDITRKRTHGRTSLLPEKQMFDLHHWISCFPFKEDTQVGNNYLQAPTPCHRYQAKLKSKAQKISKEFWTANKDLFEENSKPDLSYMSLVLDTQGSVSPSKIKKCKNKKSRMSRCKKLGTYIPKDKADSSPSDLLKTDKNILLVGKSGIGKTALTHEMLKLWTEKDDKELNYMFYFDMRKISNIKSLEDLLFNEFSEPDEGNDEVLQDIKNNSDNVTLIFDGITDLSLPVVQKLVKKDLLKDSKVVVTCRPADEDHLLSEDFLRVEVKGFSEQTIKTFISRMLRERKERVLSNLELFTLCHVPMYALMVAACFTFETSEDFQKPCCITDIYINIFRFCLERNSNTKYIHLDAFIESKSQEILSLAEVAFRATEGKTVNLTLRPFRDSCVLSLLKQLVIKVAPTERITTYAFLHYTMQEFFAALWLLKNPDLISNVFQQCLTEEKKHMKHLIPYMCRLLTEKSPSLMEYLIPAEELKNTSNWFFKKVISTFLPSLCGNDDPDTEDSGRILFLCQCLYESQCPEACIDLLEQLDFHLDLSEESLDPYPCCAVAYVITQSKERKIWLNLEDVTMSQQGMRPLLGCLPNVQWCDSLPLQLWEIFLLSEGEMDYITLLGLDGNQLHLPVEGGRKLFERAVTVLQKISKKVKICLHWEREKPDCHSLCETLLEALPYVSSLSFRRTYRGPGLQDQERCYETLKRQEKQLFLDLCLRAANHIQGESVHNEVNDLISLFSFNTDVHNILLDFYQHVKTQESSVVIEKLKPFFQSAPAVWIIDLSERKSSILLEVLRLQPEKKQVELRGCSEEESEVRTLLQCLPHISQLSFVPQLSEPSGELRFFGTLFCAAAEREQQTGEKLLQLLLSVCTYQTTALTDIVSYYFKRDPQCDFLLDLYSHLKDCETKSGLSVLPSLQSVLQSAPEVWIIDLSKRKSSILLEVLRLQPEKKQVELRGCSEEESEVRTLLQCLPHISQISFCFDFSRGVKFFGTLFCAAAEREQQTGEKTLQLLSSVCTYPSFPLTHIDDEDDEEFQCDFLLDLASHLKDYETKSGLSVLPSLQSVLQSAPAVWIIDLSKRKSSILLEVLRLQPEKKQVKLIDCSEEESEVRTLLQCLPHISQLSCGPEFFQRVCAFISVRSREETEQSAALLRMPGITLLLSGELLRETCLSVGRVLQLCGANVDLILKPRKMSDKEAFALFRRTTQLHSLKLSNDMALLLGGWVRRWGVGCQVTVEELSLCPQTAQPSHRVLLKVVSSLASLLRYWAVRQLDLTEVCVPALGLTPLLLHDGPLNIKLSEKNVQQLLSLLHELQDQDLTWSFLSKFGGDLTSFSLNWELLHLLLQHPSAQTLTVNMRKNLFLQENITRLLPYLDRIVFKRPSPSFVLTAIREIYKARASFIIPSLLRSLGHVINLTCREMSPMDCVALLYTLAHSDGVKLNLLWTSIPPWKIESILLNLDKVSQLSVDRNLLLRLVHGCTASGAQQGAAESLLRTVQHRLDLSCSSCVELPEEDQSDTLRLTAEDCRAVSTILRRSRRDTQLILQECEFQDSGLDLLFPVLHKVQLRASKAVLLQLVSLVPVNSEWDTVGRAVSLCKALEGELDLSHSSLDQRACAALALILDSSEELTELDLSHCQLTDQLLLTLSAQLHKVQVLDLSHNNITDASTDLLLQLVSINPSIHTVRLFENKIVYRTFLEIDKKFEIW
ncbi:uncharacterized protein LOC117549781 isoform X2 [Gymnodraco acuticeps]|uniref:Uncharacterized protein LOC117549781 isoform X2 n=1 Tax=Gymnodraco acuticeps TaxID=8218 RepID=A0A6P8UMV7_GYMAC|nr:uncharacterized protein LOC117549781 isoform X2 [Gymnodraco acuticeps]